MIQIQHLTITTHTKDLRELVHDLNLTIATGEKSRHHWGRRQWKI